MTEPTNRRANKTKKRKEVAEGPPPPEFPSKEEYAIAKWMRKHVPVKKTKFLSHSVEYFIASKAVDKLMDSPWTQKPKTGEPLFTTRESIVTYLDLMLRHKLFHRARKITVPESELKSKKRKDKEENVAESGGGDAAKEKVKSEPTKAEGATEQDSGKEIKKTDEDKKKRKIRLDMHLEQAFIDGVDAYVWIYEPTPYYYYFFGFLVVIAVIAICLFPLWPSSVRQGVYYLSLAAAGFLVFILALAVIRLVIFCIVWAVTFGNHHFWFLPNLTEDVGFLASFWPLYKYEYKGEQSQDDKSKDETKNDEDPSVQQEEGASNSGNGDNEKGSNKEGSGNDGSHSGTDSDGSNKSQIEKDFELLDREEVEAST